MGQNLMASNGSLREKIQTLKSYIDKQEKETFNLMKENQVLRDRWELVSGNILPIEQAIHQDEPPIAAYDRLLREHKADLTKGSIYSQHPHKQAEYSSSSKISYNQFLRGNGKKEKKEQILHRRKNRINSQTKRVNQYSLY